MATNPRKIVNRTRVVRPKRKSLPMGGIGIAFGLAVVAAISWFVLYKWKQETRASESRASTVPTAPQSARELKHSESAPSGEPSANRDSTDYSKLNQDVAATVDTRDQKYARIAIRQLLLGKTITQVTSGMIDPEIGWDTQSAVGPAMAPYIWTALDSGALQDSTRLARAITELKYSKPLHDRSVKSPFSVGELQRVEAEVVARNRKFSKLSIQQLLAGKEIHDVIAGTMGPGEWGNQDSFLEDFQPYLEAVVMSGALPDQPALAAALQTLKSESEANRRQYQAYHGHAQPSQPASKRLVKLDTADIDEFRQTKIGMRDRSRIYSVSVIRSLMMGRHIFSIRYAPSALNPNANRDNEMGEGWDTPQSFFDDMEPYLVSAAAAGVMSNPAPFNQALDAIRGVRAERVKRNADYGQPPLPKVVLKTVTLDAAYIDALKRINADSIENNRKQAKVAIQKMLMGKEMTFVVNEAVRPEDGWASAKDFVRDVFPYIREILNSGNISNAPALKAAMDQYEKSLKEADETMKSYYGR
ncbi:MAG: hypothetical protein WCT04_11530 [Planctomycetota bacterium]